MTPAQSRLEIKANQFLDQIFLKLTEQKIDLGNDEIDHLCYRTTSIENYRKICSEFLDFSKLLVEVPVAGRMISTFKLETPFDYRGRSIDLIEVPAPKTGKIVTEGFEHIEVVTTKSFSELENQYQHLKLDLSGLEKEFNPELEIQLEGCAVKFHYQSLENVIELEKNEAVSLALKKSNILTKLKNYSPIISGTFPLGLGIPSSDVDILLGASDLKEISSFLTEEFKSFPKFRIVQKKIQDLDTVIAQFWIEKIPFELFCQHVHPVYQRSHQHFLIEARLLKMLGPSLKTKVHDLKLAGLKTEPAFALALGMSGDAYEELLRLCSFSEAELWEQLNPTQPQI